MKVLRVLLVEDSEADVELVREALRARNLQHELYLAPDFEHAKNFVSAIGTSDEFPCPDVLVLDLNLPKGSGHELLRIFRDHADCKNIPVIIVSSSNAASDRAQAMDLGATYYFRKPSDLDEFMQLGPLVQKIVEDSATL